MKHRSEQNSFLPLEGKNGTAHGKMELEGVKPGESDSNRSG